MEYLKRKAGYFSETISILVPVHPVQPGYLACNRAENFTSDHVDKYQMVENNASCSASVQSIGIVMAYRRPKREISIYFPISM
jgi:hypothetical protein